MSSAHTVFSAHAAKIVLYTSHVNCCFLLILLLTDVSTSLLKQRKSVGALYSIILLARNLYQALLIFSQSNLQLLLDCWNRSNAFTLSQGVRARQTFRAVRRVDSGWASTTTNFVPHCNDYTLGRHVFLPECFAKGSRLCAGRGGKELCSPMVGGRKRYCGSTVLIPCLWFGRVQKVTLGGFTGLPLRGRNSILLRTNNDKEWQQNPYKARVIFLNFAWFFQFRTIFGIFPFFCIPSHFISIFLNYAFLCIIMHNYA